ncbi:Variant-specific surface protein [Giardia duodenalis]|uniref:Variant-specific surface protein n=1 Tax=Giardia intestinalis TaxID=5741 RepID=V6TM63_GIAIN|nr:Variant-specific surface protein [Giardia intestinalis]
MDTQEAVCGSLAPGFALEAPPSDVGGPMFGRFLLAIVILQLARAACEEDKTSTDGKCKTCGVTIGQDTWCSVCIGENYAPVNGQCADVNAEGQSKTLCPAKGQGKCTQCGGASFKYKDGCYSKDTAPGQSMCTQASEGKCTEAAPGYFLNPLRANTKDSVVSCSDTTGFTDSGKTYRGVQYCERCDGAALTNAASGDAKCTKCGASKYLKDNACVDNAEACGKGYFGKPDAAAGNKCIACTDQSGGGATGCAECMYDSNTRKAICTKCTTDYLRKKADGTTECVAVNECDDTQKGFYKVVDSTNGNKCVSCADGAGLAVGADGAWKGVDGCAKCTKPADINTPTKCDECKPGYEISTDKTKCTSTAPPDCPIENCKVCSEDKRACEECNSNNYLTPTRMCIDDCKKIGNYYYTTNANNKLICKECAVANCKECENTGTCKTCDDGFYKSSEECKACDSNCKTCNGGTSADCTKCLSGAVLKYGNDGTKGTCGAGCATGTGAGACKTCGLIIDGTSYCSECAVETEYPQGGVCSSTTVRAAATCKAGSVAKGMCNSCTNGFLRMNGGCYETTKFPGKSVCEEAASAGDTCQKEAPGYHLNNNDLVTCSPGCKTCTSNTVCTACMEGYVKTSDSCAKCAAGCATCTGSTTACDTCSTGYYESGTTCVSCTESNSDKTITGVANCASCAPPLNNKGSVLCYLIKDSGSTNKSGLSAGAIAGISVAVIVVVAGLVGFLCWWFVCRGKA